MTNTEAIPHVVHVHAHKPTIESLLGIKYVLNDDSFMVTNISDESIFKEDEHHGQLRIGHEVVEVNGTAIAGQSKEAVRTLLGSLGESVVFAVKSSWTAKMELKITEPSHLIESQRTTDGEKKTPAKARLVVNYTKKKIPKFLEGRNIPMGIWHRMYAAMDTKLLPALADCYRMDEAWKKEMNQYEKIQAHKQADIFATGVKHQKQMLNMTQTTAVVTNSACLIANNIIMWMNALLQPYGLLCQLDLEAFELPKYSDKEQAEPYEVMRIKGIEFTPIDVLGNMGEFDISIAHASDDGSILTGDTDIDFTRWC
mmetsp:Transcript_39725/g.95961  ORF Transcript_39725/g.95961 Transcript_39725/m.95961 type:complete len:312 (+) Transcript_39725:87-1022(+)